MMPGFDAKEQLSCRSQIVRGISELVKIPTVYDAATVTDKMPYGKNIYEGYLWLKEKALADGFEVLEYDGHALAIRRKENEAKKRIDVVSHVDVVEPGAGWRKDPFSGEITRNYIYGRGTQDMKGSLIVTYYALKYMKEHNIPSRNEIRIVIGCDEERTMEDIRYYISKAGEPDFAFTPDGKFPFSLGEKGALMWQIRGSMDTCMEELDGGVQCNVVSPIAEAVLCDAGNYEKYCRILADSKYDGEVTREKDKLKLRIAGRAAHASRPQDGVNATVRLLELVWKVGSDPLAGHLYRCFADYYGKGVNICCDIEPMGKLTVNLGRLRLKDKAITAEIDCRYPYGISSGILTERLQKALEPLHAELAYDDRPTLADANSSYIKCLFDSYRQVSGDMTAEPVISGGVTYSKAIGNCVAFGPMTVSDKPLAHQANERIGRKSIDLLFKIYTETMIRLGNL